jgi:hypothetical protein
MANFILKLYVPVTIHIQTLSHKVVKNICSCHNSPANYHIKLYKYALPEVGIKRTTLALIGTDYRG